MWASSSQVTSKVATNNGEYVIAIYYNGDYYALPKASTMTSATTYSGTKVILNADGKVNTSDAADITWTLEEGSTSGQFYIKQTINNTIYYLYKNGTTGSSNRNIKTVTSDPHYWEFSQQSDTYKTYSVKSLRGSASLYLTNNSGTSTIGVYGSTNSGITLLEVGDVVTKSPIGTFTAIADKTIELSDVMEAFDASDYFTKASGATQTVNFTVTPTEDQSSTGIYYENGYLCVEQYGEQEFTVTATPTGSDVDGFEAVSTTFTVTCPDNRTAVGTITAISPTTVYVGQTGSFTLTESYAGAVASKAWSLGDGEDAYLDLADEMFEGLAAGDVNVTVTATPSNTTLYKPAMATFPVTVAYKYETPELPASSAFFTTKSITIPAISGADIYYTIDGTTPTKSSTKYTTAIELSSTTTVKAIAIDADGLVSDVASATYTKETVFDIAGTTVEFDCTTVEFADGVSGYNNDMPRTGTITNSDADKTLSISGSSIMKNSGIQFRSSPAGNMTTGWIQNGAKALSITPTFSNGLTYVISYYDGTSTSSATATTNTAITPEKFPCQITFTRSSGTPVMSKLTLTALKDPIATDVIITDPGTLAKGATGTFEVTSTDAAVCTKAWTSSNSSVIEITNAATGAYEAKGRGTAKITLTITPEDAVTYREVTAERTVSVTEPVVVTADNITMTYGDAPKAIGASISNDYEGTLAYVSGNTDIATVDASGNITAVAVGTTTITISAPADADNLYTEGENVEITVTVNEPAGSGTTPAASESEIYSNTLKADNLPTGWTGDGTIWHGESSYGAVAGSSTSGNGTEGQSYDLVSPDINLNGYEGSKLIFDHTGRDFSTPSSACKVFVQEGDDTPVELLGSTDYFTGTNWTWKTNVTVNLSAYDGKNIHIIFRYIPSSGNDGKWEVRNFKIKAASIQATNVTVAASGYGSYCYEYPIDLDQLDENVKAYIVTNVEGTTVTFTPITGTIKGGVPFILYGTSGSHTLTLANESTNVPDDNMLRGTLAPTYITTENGDYTNFGLSGGKFVKINPGTLPANKAYLPVLTANVPTTNAPMQIVFNDATGISQVENVQLSNENYYDLQGRRILNPTKGLYIVNGKKVVIK